MSLVGDLQGDLVAAQTEVEILRDINRELEAQAKAWMERAFAEAAQMRDRAATEAAKYSSVASFAIRALPLDGEEAV